MVFLLLVMALSIPIIEIVVIIRVSELLGAGWTVTLLVGASVAGLVLIRREGGRAVAQARMSLQQGRWPGDAVARGAAAVVGGSLLVAPGFVSDVVGLVLLAPPTRALVLAWFRRRAQRAVAQRAVGGRAAPHREVIDVEVVEIRRATDEPRPALGDSTASDSTASGDAKSQR